MFSSVIQSLRCVRMRDSTSSKRVERSERGRYLEGLVEGDFVLGMRYGSG